jgi:hypothetical protein
MSDKIVFNGQEFDGVEAMPADLRKQYEDVMRLLADSGQAPAGGTGPVRRIFSVKTNFHTRVFVNKKEYKSVDELPPELRSEYERAVGSGGQGNPESRPEVALPVRQILLILLGAVFIGAWWFMRRR